MLIDILLLIAGLVVLIMGGEFLVRGATSLALRVHISPLVVGLTVVAFGTSAPELLISLNAALGGSPDLAMGNVVGSNICNLALVLGVTVILGPVYVNPDSIRIDWPVTMGASVLLFLLVRDQTLSFAEGLVFVIGLISYTTFIIVNSRRASRAERAVATDLDVPDTPSKSIYRDLLTILIGATGLYFGADWFVTGSIELAKFLEVSERIIGLTVVALGTSLPELVTAIVASFKKETDLAIGNLLGSNIFNILSILGITSMVKQIHVSETILNVDMLWMLGITLLILPLMLIRRKLSITEGVVLLAIYVYYIYNVINS
jgi:cation:H+ antiporter